MTDPHWTTYLAALLTPTITIFGAMIAYRQWRIAQNKLKLDLFERRLAIYETATGYISSVMITGKTSQVKEMEFLTGIRGAKWLFNDEIVQYLNKDLWHKICDLGCVQSELEGMAVGEERTQKHHARSDLTRWLAAQHEVIDNKFSPFLSLRH